MAILDACKDDTERNEIMRLRMVGCFWVWSIYRGVYGLGYNAFHERSDIRVQRALVECDRSGLP